MGLDYLQVFSIEAVLERQLLHHYRCAYSRNINVQAFGLIDKQVFNT